MKWKNKALNLSSEQINFRGITNLSDNILKLDTPFQVFQYLFPDEIVDYIRDQSNIYSTEKNLNKPLNATSIEIRQFIGILYYMSIVEMPNARMYWSEKIGFAPIKETMSQKDLNKCAKCYTSTKTARS